MEKRFVGMQDLAVYLDVSVHTVKSWVYSGRLPFKKIGRLVKFDLRKINELLEDDDFLNSYSA